MGDEEDTVFGGEGRFSLGLILVVEHHVHGLFEIGAVAKEHEEVSHLPGRFLGSLFGD